MGKCRESEGWVEDWNRVDKYCNLNNKWGGQVILRWIDRRKQEFEGLDNWIGNWE